MDLQLKGKSALVFGGSRGLGRAIAAELAREGAQVVIVSRDEAALRKTAEATACLPLAGDLSAPGAGGVLVTAASTLLDRPIDILVTNTGGPPTGSFQATHAAAWTKGFQGLWMSTVDSIQAVLPAMKANRWGGSSP